MVAETRKKVLIVDDDEPMREVISEYLELHGFQILQAENGLEGLLQMKHERPGVILLDLGMPRLGGVEALKRSRKFDPSIRVIVVTGNADAQLHEQARSLGAAHVLMKPVAFQDLGQALG